MPALLLAVVLVALAGLSPAGAQGPGDQVSPEGYVYRPDDGIRELGAEYINDFHGYQNYLSMTSVDALSLRNRLRSCGWYSENWYGNYGQGGFIWGNDNAWEIDWKNNALGGQKNSMIEQVDLAYISSHGWWDGFIFGNRFKNDSALTTSECHYSTGGWGQIDLDWVGLSTCSALSNTYGRNWARCMNGLRLVMGFVTTMADVNHGDWLGWLMCNNWSLMQAWFRAADALQPHGAVARVLAEESWMFNDTQWNHASADYYDNYYWYWTHTVGSEPARQVNVQALNGYMPVFQTAALSLDAASAKFTSLGTAFGVSTNSSVGVQMVQQDQPISTTAGAQLQMDPNSGLFSFVDTSKLWTYVTPTLGTQSMVKLSPQDAYTVANQFLTANGLLPADAHYYETLPDTLTQAQPGLGLEADTVVTTTDIGLQVIYSRLLTYTVPAAVQGGPQAEVTFSVMGPGAKLKVNLPPTMPAGISLAAMAATPPEGAIGGWRALNALSVQRAAGLVPILTYPQIAALYEELAPVVVLGYEPLQAVTYTIHPDWTVAYYEQAMGVSQGELIPTYVLTVTSTLTDTSQVTHTVYIPANETYMAPLVEIDWTGVPNSVRAGAQISMHAEDAALPLNTLGYSSVLTFPLGSGVEGAYTYAWYRDSVAPANLIQSGISRYLTTTVQLGDASHSAGVVPQTIILLVTDGNHGQAPNQSAASYTFNVIPPVFLPMVTRAN